MRSEKGAEDGRAERVFFEYLARIAAGEELSFDAFCAERAELAEELRALERLHAESTPAGRSFSQRLAQRFGRRADPRVTLTHPAGEQAEPASGLSAEVLERLGERRGAFGRYVLKGEVGRGGQGVVVQVWDEDLRRALAMKVLLGKHEPHASGDTPLVDARSLGRFLEEAQVTGQLDHPGIVPVHELGLDDDGRVYFTMKLVKGETLKSVLELVPQEKDGWTRTRALGILQRVCEAMSYAHHKGVVHRDLKPGNVMVGRFGEVYVMDWGLAKVLGRADAKNVSIAPLPTTAQLSSERRERAEASPDSPLLTMDGDVVGTPAYMSPEQAIGSGEEVGPQSDVYSMGAMLYHLLSGHMPYVKPGMRLSNYAVWYQVQAGPPDPIARLAPDAPAELAAICERAMAREVDRRYPDMKALSEDLTAYLEGRVVSAYEAGAWAEARKWVQRNRPLAAALAAALVLLVAGLATSLVFKADADESAALAIRRAEETDDQARLAKANEERALRSEASAKELERLATARAEDLLRLSASEDLDELMVRADALWPAHAENIARYEAWIDKARELVGGLTAHRATLADLRSRALPQTEAERRASRESHPLYQELVRLEKGLALERAALLQRRDGIAAAPLMLDWSLYLSDANSLNKLAWRRVNPERVAGLHPGEEALGLALAQRALELAESDADRAAYGDTLAWAYFAVGRDDDALNASYKALEEAPPEEKEKFAAQLETLEQAVEVASSAEGLEHARREIEQLEARRLELESLVLEQELVAFSEQEREAHWWSNQLSKLVAELEQLQAGLLAEDAIVPEHGWSIPKRLAFARELQAGFAPGGTFALAWERDLPAIRAAYPELEITPQIDLVPIGPDPASGLWEFAHLQTGKVARRRPDGRLQLDETTGLVLVLLPGGSFSMGAQSFDPNDANFDPNSQGDEGPVHEVRLTAFFSSKFEMTQGQWASLTGRNPSHHQSSADPRFNSRHPVEQVSWVDAMEVLRRLGMTLPSEAQWEYGARAGTRTPWWTGAGRESLRGKVNVADRTAMEAGATWGEITDWRDLEDGWWVHAPVDELGPNPFGLFHVHGNVWEWCLDGYVGDHTGTALVLDPVVPSEGFPTRTVRGGSYRLTVKSTRSASRTNYPPESRHNVVGLRPVRTLKP